MGQVSFTIVINSPAETSATWSPAVDGSGAPVVFTAPVAQGTVFGSITVQPSNWNGVFTSNNSAFSVIAAPGPLYSVVASTVINAPGSYAVTITMTP